ncbi:MAG: hypothetical protein ACK5EP_03485, partial [Bacteroidota bacterium]
VNKWVLYTIAFIISYLMISSIRLINLKFKNFTWKENTSRYLLIIISVAAVLALGWIAGFVILITYILVSLLFKKELQ